MHTEYPSFAALAAAHKEGQDFDRIILARRHARVVIVAPHGGRIEPHTDSIAEAIAASDFSLYCFRSKRRKAEANLHITSHNFDDPVCLALVSEHRWAVAIHGCSVDGERAFLGGRDSGLISALAQRLRAVEVPVETDGHKYVGIDPKNVCNRTKTSGGAQFELSMGFRRGPLRAIFIDAVRAVLLVYQDSG